MARPQRVSDEEVLGEMRRAVLEHGPHVSLDRVAKHLGVSTPALFRRFGDRKNLMLAALRPNERPPFLDEIERGPDARPAQAQLTELFTHIARYFSAVLPCLSALRESGLNVDDLGFDEPPPLRTTRVLTGWLERALRTGLLEVESPVDTATAMLGAVWAPVFLRHMAKRTDPWNPAKYAAGLAALFVRGLGGAPERPPRASKPRPRRTAR